MPYKSEPELVLDLVKEVGAARLGNFDGCVCSRFEVRNVHVDICCGKGRDRGIYIWSHSMDYLEEDHEEMLRPIAEEVARQVQKADERGPLPIKFHEWKKEDH